MTLTILLPDHSQRTFNPGSTAADVAASISKNLLTNAVAAKINDAVVDLSTPISDGDRVQILTLQTPEGIEVLRHSSAHLLAMALQQEFPGLRLSVGPVIENQFYYDVCPMNGVTISPEHFPQIEKRMQKIAEQKLKISRKTLSRAEAIAWFQEQKENFKVELIGDIPAGETISLYEMGGWADLCRGPHVPHTGFLKHFKLMSLSGAYWRADATKEQLTRIYGTAWSSSQDLETYLHMLSEAKKRDHVLLGKQLELFTLMPDVAPGAPFFLPNGAKLYTLLQSYMRRKVALYGFVEVLSPQVFNVDLWKVSGHYDNYKEDMFLLHTDDGELGIKPMSCPGHARLFMASMKSYRDLPLRFFEFGTVHRNELSGAVHGLTRVRRFTQDDGHIFCTMEHVQQEIRRCLQLVKDVYKDFGITNIRYGLSTRPAKRLGTSDDALWDRAEADLRSALTMENTDFFLREGDGAFYGPKIDILIQDAISRWHQCATIQLDFQTLARFGATYIDSSGHQSTPVMIHRAVFGAVERFLGVYIEHTAGHFQVGLSPTQAILLPVKSDHEAYCRHVEKILIAKGLRVEVDASRESLSYKIRGAQTRKIPYMVIVGDKEQENQTLQPRFWDGTNLEPQSVEQFVELIKTESQPFWGLDANQNA